MKSITMRLSNRRVCAGKGRIFIRHLILIFMAVSCGGGGTDVAGGGIGGSGYTAVGPVTALGSIFVNEVEFETTGATVILNGISGRETDLQVGMVVKVEGVVNPDGKTGRADTVSFNHNLEGPLTSVDFVHQSIEIMGQTVLVDSRTMIAGMPQGTADLSLLSTGDQIEVSGLTDIDGNIWATRLVRKESGDQPELIGKVSHLMETSFSISGLTIDFAQATLSGFGASGIQSSDFVSVRGTLISTTTMKADRIEKRTLDIKGSGSIGIEGYIDSLLYANGSIVGYTIGTPFGLQRVELDDSSVVSEGALMMGARVRVEGAKVNNVIMTRQLKMKGSSSP